MNAIRSLTILTSGVLLSAVAFAKPMTFKEWSFDDSNAVCVASTTRAVNGQTYRFELSYDKSGTTPVEAWMREVPSTSSAKAFRLVTEVAPIQNFGFIPMQDAAGNLSYWQVPTDTNALISYIKLQTRLIVQVVSPTEAAKSLEFSLRGSSDAVNALIQQCANGKAIVSDFEKSFVPAQTASLDPLKYDTTKSAQLRALYQSAFAANTQRATYQRQLAALNTQYAKQIQELGQVTGTLDQLTTKELVNLQNQKVSLQQQMDSLDQQIASQQAAISAKEADVAAANAVYSDAWNILAPYEPEHQRLNTLVQNSQSDLKKYQAQLNSIDQGIQSANSDLADAQNQVSSLNSQLAQADSAVQNARGYATATDSIYRNFDYNRERYDRVEWHPLTQFCRQYGGDRCQSLMFKVANYADSEVQNIQSRLSSNAAQTRDNLNQAMNAYSRISNQLSDYQNNVIPGLQNRISDLRSQRPAADANVSRTRDDIANRTAALQSYDQSVGYAQKKADVDAKAAVVVGLQNDLKLLQQSQGANQTARNQAAASMAATDKAIQNVLARIQANQGRESELNKALTPYFAEKARIDAGVTQTSATIDQNKAAFAAIITG